MRRPAMFRSTDNYVFCLEAVVVGGARACSSVQWCEVKRLCCSAWRSYRTAAPSLAFRCSAHDSLSGTRCLPWDGPAGAGLQCREPAVLRERMKYSVVANSAVNAMSVRPSVTRSSATFTGRISVEFHIWNFYYKV
jgi:hypothetical protein